MIQALLLVGALLGEPARSHPSAPPVLEFRVLGPDGKPARVDVNRVYSGDCERRVLSCVRCPSGEPPDPWNETPAGAHSAACAADTAFQVEAGERYVYAYIGKNIRPIEGEVTIAKDAPLTTVELRIAPEPKLEMLRIRLMQPNELRIDHDFQIAIESVETGLTLFRWKRWQFDGESSWGDALPVGRYRVRVTTDDNGPECGPPLGIAPAPFGDWTDVVELREGAPRQIDARMWLGGKLRLALDLPAGMPPREELWTKQHPYEGSPLEAHWLRLGTRGPAARVTLKPDPDAPRPLHERGMPDVTDAPLQFLCQPQLWIACQYPGVLPGREQTSADQIPPGAYIARIEARDFAPVESKVRIQAGETTELRIELTPR